MHPPVHTVASRRGRPPTSSQRNPELQRALRAKLKLTDRQTDRQTCRHTGESVGETEEVNPDVAGQMVDIDLCVVARLVLMVRVNLSAVDQHVVADDDRGVVRSLARNGRHRGVIRQTQPAARVHVVRHQL